MPAELGPYSRPQAIQRAGLDELANINEKLNALSEVQKDIEKIKKDKTPKITLIVCAVGVLFALTQVVLIIILAK